jgi:hypothetical protein
MASEQRNLRCVSFRFALRAGVLVRHLHAPGAQRVLFRVLMCVSLVALPACRKNAGGAGSNQTDIKAAVAGQGLEVTLWSLADAPSDVATGAPGQRLPGAPVQAALEDALAGLMQQGAVSQVDAPEEVLRAWEGSGLRVLRVRASEIPALERAIGASAGQRRSWVAFGSYPTELVRGSRADTRSQLATDVGQLAMNGGAVAMSVRGWTLPALPASMLGTQPQTQEKPDQRAEQAETRVAQVELLLSLAPRESTNRATIIAQSAAEAQAVTTDVVPGQGAVQGLLQRLTLGAMVAQGDCLLIESTSSSAMSEPQGKGPPVPTLPTLGEALLSDVFAFPRAGVRLVIVIRPVVQTRNSRSR